MPQQVVLLRVGIDTGSGGMLGPLFADGSFEFIPIPDGLLADVRTYDNTIGRHGRWFSDYFPIGLRDRMRKLPMHVDPEFDSFTYGDPTKPKAGLRRLLPGDLLVFYAGLKGYDCDRVPALYIVGYFEVTIAGYAAALGEALGQDTIRTLFASNFHVMHPNVFATQRDQLVLVKGSAASKVLQHAVKISEMGVNRVGRPIHVLSRPMQEVFGDFSGKVSIQRSPPRWVAPEYVERAAAFVQSLE